MTRSNASPRLTHLLAIVAAMLSLSVCAQPLPQDSGSDADPPSRVARMSYASGRVSFSPGGSDAWVEARVNRPIVTGDRLWADSDSRAEVAIDNSTWWLGDTTSIAVSNLDDRIVQMQVQEGVLEVRVRRVPADNIVEIDTPNLAFSITRPGRYRVEVDPQDGSTMVAVRDGSGDVYGEGGSYVITAGQAYRFYGTDVSDSEFVALPPVDAFTRFVQDRDRVYTSSASLRYVSPAVKTDSRALVVEAVVLNDRDRLKPGLFVTARLEQASRTPAVLVPTSAVRMVGGAPRVYVVGSNKAVEERLVTAGQTTDGLVEIASGLKAGEVVASSNITQLADGARVTVAK